MISVNNTQITEETVLSEMQYHKAPSVDDAKFKAAQSLVITELVKQAADKEGYNDAEEFVSYIVDEQLLDYAPNAEEIRRYYDNNKNKFHSSPLVEARHILLAASPEDAATRSNALRLAQQLIEQIVEDPGQFSALAEQHSSCPSAKTQGHLGQLSRGQTVPEFERQIFGSEEGLCMSPIESRYGIHVVALDHKEPGRLLPFDAVQGKILSYLQERQKVKAISHYLQSLVNDADIKGIDMEQSATPLMQ
jgi:peptidyl-prolyl cis-trans isomerase C